MTASDLPAVGALADAVHGALLFEPPEVFAERLALFPQGCFVVGAPVLSPVLAYAFTHPWRMATPPPLGTMLGVLPAEPDCLYLHDVVVAPQARAAGLGASLVVRLRQLAAGLGLSCMALTAGQHSSRYWARHGFTVGAVGHASYGADAVCMVAPIRLGQGNRQ